jgi:D-arabinan exo alpha-(1,3)/(1,5)-arabinofuranosidase (non-reducing end)
VTGRRLITLLCLAFPACSSEPRSLGAGAGAGIIDPLAFTQLRDFEAYRSSSTNPDSTSNDDSARPIPGETEVLADLEGPGIINHIWLTVAGNEYGWPRLLRLRVYYDGSEIPSVDAPVGDFFGVGHGMERVLNSLVIRNSSSGRSRNSYWPMPFRRSIKITITNEGTRRLYNLYYHVDWEKHRSLPRNTAYFHARYRQALPPPVGDWYDFLTVHGRGFYVGTVLSAVQVAPGWFGEGDDLFYVDGNPKPVIMGTGTEDYANDAWSFRVDTGPYAGVTVADGTETGARLSAYRWHLNDPIPFRTSLRAAIEHAGWTFNEDGRVRSAFEERPDFFSSVAYWYQEGIAQDQPEPPYGAARLPQGNAQQIEIEDFIDDARVRGGTLEVQPEVFWGKDLLFLNARGPGARVDVPLDVPADGRYEIIAQTAQAPDYGIYRVEIDGRVAGASGQLEHEPGANIGAGFELDGYFHEVFVGEDRVLAWPTLKAGRHTVSFINVGKNSLSTGYHLGLDGLVLARIAGSDGIAPRDSASAADPADRIRRLGNRGPAATAEMETVLAGLRDSNDDVRLAAAWVFTQMGDRAAPAVDALTTAMADRSRMVRGLVAIALRHVPATEATGDTLLAHLKDPDENVRMVVANAIAAHPEVARRGIDALMVAAQVPGEHRHVLRSIATALGATGSDGARALPVLRTLADQPLVRWQAEAAIRVIQGER